MLLHDADLPDFKSPLAEKLLPDEVPKELAETLMHHVGDFGSEHHDFGSEHKDS